MDIDILLAGLCSLRTKFILRDFDVVDLDARLLSELRRYCADILDVSKDF